MSRAPTDRDHLRPFTSASRPAPATPTAPPLRERSTSQHNTLAIRIVPYSPPRLDGNGPGQESSSASRPHATEGGASGSGNEEPSSTHVGWPRDAGVGKEGYASSHGSALSSPSSPTFSLARPWEGGVSASKPAANRLSSPPPPAGRGLSHLALKTPAGQGPSAAAGDGDADSTPASPTSSTPRPRSRRRNLITVHADKTFSLIPRAGAGGGSVTPSDTHASLRSPPLSFSSTLGSSSSHERLYSDALSDDRPSSPPTTTATTIPDLYSLSAACTPSPGSSTVHLPLIEDPIPASSSPWNYRLVGGLRKVPKTPDLKQKQADYAFASSSVQPTPATLAPLPEAPSPAAFFEDNDDGETPSRPRHRFVAPKTSFASEQSHSTLSETSNYKVYDHSSSPAGASPDRLPRPHSSDSHIQLLGESSPPRPLFESSPLPPRTADSDRNYVVHGDPSPLAPSVVAVPRRPRPTYSQESLKVAPLQPTRKRSHERFGYYKSRSRESLRHAASLQSISSVISQDSIAPFLVAPAFVNLRGAAVPGPSSGKPDSWASAPKDLLPPPPPSDPELDAEDDTVSSLPERRVPMIEAHPHQWSSQLSTVVSESEGESDNSRLPSRSVSLVSGAPSRSDQRRSSTGWASSHSRQMLSISSSLGQQLDDTRTHSRTDSHGDSVVDRPWATYARPAVTRTVRDQDEHGDGLTDLQRVHQQPSRSGLSGFFGSSSNSSGRNLASSHSSRAGSLTSASLPAWARVYYGSGERKRFASAISLASDDDASRPPSSFHASGSPSTDGLPLHLYSARKRAREVHPRARRDSDVASLDASHFHARRGLRRMTSSIWSPHLRTDRRASRYSVWDPPSVQWSADSGGVLGRRNAQVVLFMVGFLVPFAWMVAAFLPIPPDPQGQKLREKGKSPNWGRASDTHSEEFVAMPAAFQRQLAQADERRYQSAKWWRTLNRVMAFLGLLILGAIAALVVIGVREGWGQGMPS